ncbi:PLC-like phosphodiesterase [Myriangium duriaei CBS 260.36]|uniref:PLC-like phosphodiesterase n=1 Tax=Myriangium duriaei CBS 260.36 TaxID=1168546 RepID=A0A9P4MPX5_9PEZI|nr:PLC-like phosphodiesterase [Myriangium duriaei CBS 260.36]
MDSLLTFLAWIGAPPLLSDGFMRMLAEESRCPTHLSFPEAHFAQAKEGHAGQKFPQAIAHRGYNSRYPENTMLAFKGAIEVGSHALETDIRLTRDGVVVLSHDPTLKRCFGVDKRIADCDWDYISTLRTVKEPHEPMPTLKDLMGFLSQSTLKHIWLLLDVKVSTLQHMIACKI